MGTFERVQALIRMMLVTSMVLGATAVAGPVPAASADVGDEPFVERRKVVPAGGEGGEFGQSVAVDGNTMLVGAPGIGGEDGTLEGAAYVFGRLGSAWYQEAVLSTPGTVPDEFGSDYVGWAVALDGDTAVLAGPGAPTQTGSMGEAHVFVRRDGLWSLQQTVMAGAHHSRDFGMSVDVSGDLLAIGFPHAAATENGKGHVSVFRRSGTQWSLEADLPLDFTDRGGMYGHSVAVSGDTVLVGDPTMSSGPAGNDTSGGIGHVFAKTATGWTKQATLRAFDAQGFAELGWSVALDGDTAVLGARGEPNTGLRGAAYVFTRNGETWSQQEKLMPSTSQVEDEFGYAVALSGDTAIISATTDDDGPHAGRPAVTVFERSGSTWTERQLVTSSDPAAQSFESVAFDGSTLVLGAPLVFRPDPAHPNGGEFGAAYSFTREAPAPASLEVAVDATPDDAQDFRYRLSWTSPGEIPITADAGFFLDDDPSDTAQPSERLHGDIDPTQPVSLSLKKAAGGFNEAEGPPAGWVLQSIDCGTHGVFTTATVRLDLQPGEQARCTLRLVRVNASLIVAVDAVPHDPQDFRYRLTWTSRSGDLIVTTNAGFNLDDDPADATQPDERLHVDIDSTHLVALSLKAAAGGINEPDGPPPGWALLAIDCGTHGVFTATTIQLDLQPREQAHCTFRLQEAIAPVVTGTPDREPNANGWYRDDVTIDWQSSDPAPTSGTPSDPADTIAGTEGAGVLYESASSCDPVGNCAGGSLALSIDKTPPSVTCQSPPPVYVLGESNGKVQATVGDSLSGPGRPSVSAQADTSSVGFKTVAITGEDRAGNRTMRACGYRVEYAFDGFASPIENPPERNSATAGQSIRLMWRITDAQGRPVTTLTEVTIRTTTLPCAAGTTPDVAPVRYTIGRDLVQAFDGTYLAVWHTPRSYAGSCKTMHLDLGEGGTRTALFEFRA